MSILASVKRYVLGAVGILAAAAIGTLYIMLRIARGHAAAAQHAAAQANKQAAQAIERAKIAQKSARVQRQVSTDAAQAALDAAQAAAAVPAPDPAKHDDFDTAQ